MIITAGDLMGQTTIFGQHIFNQNNKKKISANSFIQS